MCILSQVISLGEVGTEEHDNAVDRGQFDRKNVVPGATESPPCSWRRSDGMTEGEGVSLMKSEQDALGKGRLYPYCGEYERKR